MHWHLQKLKPATQIWQLLHCVMTVWVIRQVLHVLTDLHKTRQSQYLFTCPIQLLFCYQPADAHCFKTRLHLVAGIPVLNKWPDKCICFVDLDHAMWQSHYLIITHLALSAPSSHSIQTAQLLSLALCCPLLSYQIKSNSLIFDSLLCDMLCVWNFEWNVLKTFARDLNSFTAPTGRPGWRDCLWHKW